MQPPRWDDPIGGALAEATPTIQRNLRVRPTLYGFVDGEPTVRVRAATSAAGSGLAWVAVLAGAIWQLELEQVLVFSHVRLVDDSIGDADVRDAVATSALGVEVGERRAGAVTSDLRLIEHDLVDGRVRWHEPHVADGALFARAIEGTEGPAERMDPATWAYGMSRTGHVVEVAPGWRERYGFHRLRPRVVRATDRARVRRLERTRSDRGREVA